MYSTKSQLVLVQTLPAITRYTKAIRAPDDMQYLDLSADLFQYQKHALTILIASLLQTVKIGASIALL